MGSLNQTGLCPFNMRFGLYAAGALANIDHNPTSASSSSSFYGKGMSFSIQKRAYQEWLEKQSLSLKIHLLKRKILDKYKINTRSFQLEQLQYVISLLQIKSPKSHKLTKQITQSLKHCRSRNGFKNQ